MKGILAGRLTVCLATGARPCRKPSWPKFFKFENGSVLPELRVAYETYGNLNPGRDNAILLVHGTNGNRHAFDPLIGPGKTFDTGEDFVITVDASAAARHRQRTGWATDRLLGLERARRIRDGVKLATYEKS
jgi:hypothetical protein